MSNLIMYKDKIIGEVINGVYYKSIKGSKNILKNGMGRLVGIALNMNEVNDLKKIDAKRIHITDTESGRIYTISFEIFLRSGHKFNIGYGDQMVLPMGRWTCLLQEQPELIGFES